jgi:hypothetical protein
MNEGSTAVVVCCVHCCTVQYSTVQYNSFVGFLENQNFFSVKITNIIHFSNFSTEVFTPTNLICEVDERANKL